ncbi:hypothetical protein MRX96_036087, partial [Rhipicephalus microplus]
MAPPRKSNVEVGSHVVVKDHPLPARVIHIQGNRCQIQFVDDSFAVVHLSSVTKSNSTLESTSAPTATSSSPWTSRNFTSSSTSDSTSGSVARRRSAWTSSSLSSSSSPRYSARTSYTTETSVTVRSRTTRSRSASKSPKTKRVTSRSRSRSASRATVTSPRTPRSPQKKAATPKSPSPAKKTKSPAKKSPAPKSPARLPKTARPKSPGRPKSPAPKSPARKSPAAKSPARKTPAKTRAPSKSPARTTTQRKRSVSPAKEKGDDTLRVGPSRIPVSSSSSSSSLEITEKPPVLSRPSLSTPLGASASQPVVSLTTNSITRRVVSSPVAGVSPHAVRSSPRIATMHATSVLYWQGSLVTYSDTDSGLEDEDDEKGPSTSRQGLVNIVEPRARFRVHMPQWRLPFSLGMTLSSLFWFFLVPSLAFVLYLLCQKESCTIMKAPRVPRTLDAYFHWKLFIGYPAPPPN